MPALAPSRPLITLLRGSSRLAALVLALFLAALCARVACADHDLADAGIGQHQSHVPSPDGTDAGGAGTVAHAYGHCCHAGVNHVPALATVVSVLPIASSQGITLADVPTPPSAVVQRELRPPIR